MKIPNLVVGGPILKDVESSLHDDLKHVLTCFRYSHTRSRMSAKRLTVLTKLSSFPTPLLTLLMQLQQTGPHFHVMYIQDNHFEEIYNISLLTLS